MANAGNATIPTLNFPTRNEPRVWFITSGDCSLGIPLAKQALDHGDYVISGISQAEFEADEGRSHDFKHFLAEVSRSVGWKDRLKIVALDIRCAFSGDFPYYILRCVFMS